MGKPLLGQMMDMPLLVSSLISRRAARGDTEIVSKRVEGDLHRYTYRDCERRAKQLAQALARLGVETGDRVGTLAWNGYRHLEAYYGIGGMGAVCHTINPRLFPEQIAYIVNHAEDRYVFFDINFAPLVEAIAPQCPHVKGWVAMTDAAHLPSGTTPFLCYETLVSGGRPLAAPRRAAGVGAVHVGHDRQPEGRAVFAPLDRVMRRRAARRDEPVRDGRRAASRADVPRQRMGLRTRCRSRAASWCCPARISTGNRCTS